jgi:hypothetical protein
MNAVKSNGMGDTNEKSEKNWERGSNMRIPNATSRCKTSVLEKRGLLSLVLYCRRKAGSSE